MAPTKKSGNVQNFFRRCRSNKCRAQTGRYFSTNATGSFISKRASYTFSMGQSHPRMACRPSRISCGKRQRMNFAARSRHPIRWQPPPTATPPQIPSNRVASSSHTYRRAPNDARCPSRVRSSDPMKCWNNPRRSDVRILQVWKKRYS